MNKETQYTSSEMYKKDAQKKDRTLKDNVPSFPSYKSRYDDLINCSRIVKEASLLGKSLPITTIPSHPPATEASSPNNNNFTKENHKSSDGVFKNELKNSPLLNLLDHLSDSASYLYNPLMRSRSFVSTERELNLFREERMKLDRILKDEKLSNYEKERALAAYRQSVFSWTTV